MDTATLGDAQVWAEKVFGGCRMMDRRHERRLVQVAELLAKKPDASLPAACGEDTAAQLGAYRLIENERVDPQAIADGGFAATVESAAGAERMLMASDTTTLRFRHAAAASLGDIGGPAERDARGWLVHSSLLIDAQQRTAIGLIDQQWHCRDPQQRGRKHQRRQRPYEQKESFKWQANSERVADRLGPVMARVVELCDAEADIYEYLQYKVQNRQRFVVRVAQDRALSESDQKLWQHLGAQRALGQMTIEVRQKGGRAARQATLTLRAARVTLRPPHRRGQGRPEPLSVQAVLAEEENPPADVDNPLCWRLYTSEPATTLGQARQVVEDYGGRWQIEEFHKAWKSGCKVEQQRQQTPDNLQRIAQVQAFVAVRLLQIQQHAALKPDKPCQPLLDELGWKCLWLSAEKSPLPDQPPSQRWALHAIARLGGWHNSKRTGRPGWTALTRGWQELQARLTGYRLAVEWGPL